MLTGHTIKKRYRIYDKLGQGGAAVAYLARDLEKGQMVVVKVVHAHLVDERFRARFEREIDLLQQLTSPYIMQLYDWALNENDEILQESLSYLVTEHVQGHNLADIIDTQGKMEEETALAITRHLALALAEVHARGIVHRDVKAQNIMITPENKAILIDFGIAKGTNHATLTDPSHFAGTLYYAAPEQILETHNVDHRADLYSLGIVLYEMLTAELPVQARDFGEAARQIIEGDLKPITGVSADVVALVDAMTESELDNRIASANEVVRRIEALGKVSDETVFPTTQPVPVVKDALKPKAVDEAEKLPNYLLLTNDGRKLVLDKRVIVVGRSHPRDATAPDVDLAQLGVENARTASRQHCRVYFENGQYFVEDLGSMNGTSVNGNSLKPGDAYRLSEGDVIGAGQVELSFQAQSMG